MPPPAGLAIGQVSALLGVPVPTIRSWHLRYGLALPERTAGGHRRYSTEQVQVLQALNAAVTRGLAPRAAAQALRNPGGDPEAPVALLAALLQCAERGDQRAFAATLDEAEAVLGVDAAVDRLLLPALHEIGRRWEVRLLDVGVEHLATSAARGWIARRSRPVPPRTGAGPVVLAAGPGNQHTVALEAFGMLLHRRGLPTRELGADTPVDALVSAVTRAGARAVVVTAHQASRRRGAVTALEALAGRCEVALYYAGAGFDTPARRAAVPGTYLGTSLSAAVTIVEQKVAGETPRG